MTWKQIAKRGSVLLFIGLSLVACKDDSTRRLPIAGNTEYLEVERNGKIVIDTIYHTIPPFSYLNQDSVYVTEDSFKGKILIADFMFTNCPSICPPMTTNMKRLNVMTKDLAKHVQFVSFSIDPYRDRPARLREYIKEHGIEASNWSFLTNNDENVTHDLAGYFFNFAEKNEEIAGGYGHTSYFSIIDTRGRVRGVYDGLDAKAIDSLENDLRYLLKSEYGIK